MKQTAVEFVTYELALRMKQLGFDEPCMASRDMNNNEGLIQIPLYQQAFRWFREKQGMLSCIEFAEPEYGGDYGYKLYYKPGHLHIDHWGKGYKTYEEAEFACLKKLIEIVEQIKSEQ